MRARHGPPQDHPWQDLHEEAADLWGSSSSIWQKEEDGHPLRPEGSQAQARQEVLLSRQTRTRGELINILARSLLPSSDLSQFIEISFIFFYS